MENNFVEGNFEDKYHAKNPIYRFLVGNFLKSFKKLLQTVEERRIGKIVEIGCGEGELLKTIRKYFPQAELFACDLSPNEIKKAKTNCKDLNIIFSVQNAENLKKYPKGNFNLTICSEVLEHLKNPTVGLNEIKRVTKGYAVVSIPVEPLWRFLNVARGKYLKSFGNTPSYINHWGIYSFRKFIKKGGFKIEKK